MKTYKCPYCDHRGDKEDLVSHMEDDHSEMIPEGFTPTRTVFNLVNKKDHGVCVVCKNETPWNENAHKYDRLCGKKKCSDALREAYKKNMLKVYNKTTLLNDADQQEKMLANRSISGKYNFTGGGSTVFTGSYEKKALEFIDNVLGFGANEVMAPGPVFEYEFEGKTLKWITDILLIPFNLVIEVKDGGANPNTRSMPVYREKQIAKEKMITSLGTYNYLRLTDNNFAQLLATLAELKSQMIDDSADNKKVIININEEVNMLETYGAVAGAVASHSDGYITQYGYKNTFTDDVENFALHNDIISDNIITVDTDGTLKRESMNFLEGRNICIYKFKGNHSNYESLIREIHEGKVKDVNKKFFYEYLTGKKMLTNDQIAYDEQFEAISKDNIVSETTTKATTLLDEYYNLTGDTKLSSIPLMSEKHITEAKEKLKGTKDIMIFEDAYGFFARDMTYGYRTRPYSSIKDIVLEGVTKNVESRRKA